MNKRVLSATLALAMTLSLTGCLPGSNAPSTSSGTSTSGNTSTSQPVDSNKPLAMGDTENPVTLTMVIKDHSPENEADAIWMESLNKGLLEAGIGAQVELLAMQSGTYSTNLGLMLTGGTIPDLIWFQGGDEEFALTQKILADLTPYVENSVYVKDAMEDYQLERLENYPYLLYVSPASVKVPVIRTDILDSLEIKDEFLADPTIDNYYKLFQELKEQGFNAAWTVAGDLAEINNTFDQAFGLTTTWMEQEDGSYIYSGISDAAKEKLDFYKKLYEEGLLDSDYLTDTWETKENKFYNNEVAIVSGTQGATVGIYNDNQVAANGEGAALTVLPPAKGVAQAYSPFSVAKETRGMAISALSENQALAFQVLEYILSPEGRFLELLGNEGQNWEYNDEGKVEITSTWYPFMFNTLENFDESAMAEPYYSESAQDSLDMINEYMTMDNDFTIPSDLTTSWDAAQNVVAEFYANYIIGNNTEADWDAFVQNFYDMGGQAVTDYANTVLG
mgnify:CR=1 FL=1